MSRCSTHSCNSLKQLTRLHRPHCTVCELEFHFVPSLLNIAVAGLDQCQSRD